MNDSNPRHITTEKLEKLKKSIEQFPEMLKIRPIVVDDNMVALGGNMRLKASIELGLKKVHIIKAGNLTEAQKEEFIIKDNVGFGEWDWEVLYDEFDPVDLEDWGMDLVPFDDGEEDSGIEEENYSRKIEAPIYEPSENPPSVEDLLDNSKTDELISKIEKSKISEADKDLLKKCAERHRVFNYERIADYYASAPKEVQELMEESALVIIDFDKAIENGFVKLVKDSQKLYDEGK